MRVALGCVGVAAVAVVLMLSGLASCAAVEDVREVTVVFMNHLDVGFNHGEGSNGRPCNSPYSPSCGLSSSIVNNYFDNWYPKALRTASLVQQFNETAGYTYTTHGWLLSLFMQCDPSSPPVWWDMEEIHCPSRERQAQMATAVMNGSIWWHAVPFNGEAELVDDSLFLSMVNLTQNLARVMEERAADIRWTPGERLSSFTTLKGPIAMSQRDVPGLTQSVIPLLSSMGVKMISVGVNSASSPPVVPHVFRWFDASQSSEVFALYHPNGYGWMQGDRLDPDNDCYLLDGSNSTLCLAFKGDNAGPQGFFELQEDYFQLRHTFPNAVIRAGTYDDFVPVLESVRESLPIVTEEIGDTWLYGCPSDPVKLAQFRALQRCRRTSLDLGEVNIEDLQLFDFLLMKNEEHTWGEDVKTYLDDWANWSNEEFHQQLEEKNSNFVTIVNSWYDQRFFVFAALEALQNSSSTQEVFARCQGEINAVTPREILSEVDEVMENGWKPSDPLSIHTAGEFEVSFNSLSGGIQFLSRSSQPSVASEDHQLGVVTYTTYDGRDYERFLGQYLYCHPADCTWALKDYGKPNMSICGHPNSTTSMAMLEHFYEREETSGMAFLAVLSFPEDLHTNSGSPSRALVVYNFTSDAIEIDLQLENKTATRLAESCWMTFNPTLEASGGENVWRMDKMGMWVDPLNVVLNGSRSLHGIRVGVGLNATWSSSASPDFREEVAVMIESLDAGVVAPGGDSLMNFTNEEPDVTERGMSFNLFNNLWGTNYVMWYPFGSESPDIRYRWRVTVGSSQ